MLMLGMLLWSVLSIRYGLPKGHCQGLPGIDGTEEGPTTGPPWGSKSHQGWAVVRSGRDQWFSEERGRKLLLLFLEAT